MMDILETEEGVEPTRSGWCFLARARKFFLTSERVERLVRFRIFV